MRYVLLFTYFLLANQVLGQYDATGKFYIMGTRIIDPEGKEFIAKGVNVNGYNVNWPRSTYQDIDKITNCWGFNSVRLTNRLFDNNAPWPQFEDSNNIEEIIEELTSRKVVVLIMFMDHTGGYYPESQMDSLLNYHRYLATKYRDNSYVWFNFSNEPGNNNSMENVAKWIDMNRRLIQVIREDADASNLIFIDGQFWGQDVGEWNENPVRESKSTILSYGNEVINFNNKTYENIGFTFHTYDQWKYGDTKLADFIDRIHEKGFSVMVTEYGMANAGSNTKASTESLMRVANKKGIGRMVWHWYGGDENKLTLPPRLSPSFQETGGYNIDNCEQPDNLSWLGRIVWNDLRGLYENTDTKAPVTPLNLRGNAIGDKIALSWESSSDDVGVMRYNIYLDGLFQAKVEASNTNYVFTGLNAGQEYHMGVTAEDLMLNESEMASITITADNPLQEPLEAFAQDSSTSNFLVIEAENFDFSSETTRKWHTDATTAGFSGSGYIVTDNTQMREKENFVVSSPRLDYYIHIHRKAKYFVWIRGYAPDENSRTVHIGLDGNSGIFNWSIKLPVLNNWTWTRINEANYEATFTITEPGLKKVSLWMDQDGTMIDKLIFTDDPDFVPSGKGPAESIRYHFGIITSSWGQAANDYKQVRCYPTIVEDRYFIERSELNYIPMTLSLYTPNGKKLFYKTSQKLVTELDFSNFQAGLYILKFQTGLYKGFRKIVKK